MTQVSRSIRLWERLSTEGVIEEFERDEITPSSNAEPERGNVWTDCLFADAQAERTADPAAPSQEQDRIRRRNKFLKTTAAVKDEKHFVTFTPESEQSLVAELRFIRLLRAGRLWIKASDAWVTALLPKGALIRVKKTGEFAFVLKAYDCASLCWPATMVAPSVWEKSLTMQTLRWETIFNDSEVEVLPTAYRSPTHSFLEDRRP